MKHTRLKQAAWISISLVLLTACSTTGSNINQVLGTPAESRSHLLDKQLQDWLKQSLTQQDYTNFNANLKQFSASYHLKDGSIYYESRDDSHNTASAIVVKPNGQFYLAYQTPNTDETMYITNNQSCQTTLHPAIQVFNHVYPRNQRVFHLPLNVIADPQPCPYIDTHLYKADKIDVFNQSGFTMPNTLWQTQTRIIDGKPVVYEFGKGDPIEVLKLSNKVNENTAGQAKVTPKMEYDLQQFLSDPILKVVIDQCGILIELDKDHSIPDFNAMQGSDWDINRLLIIDPITHRKQFVDSKIDAISQMLWSLSTSLNGKPVINRCLSPQQFSDFNRWQSTFNQLTASYTNQSNGSNSQTAVARLANDSRVEYLNLVDSGLPPDELKKLRQDFSNLKTYGSYSQGKVTHEFTNTAKFKAALQRHGSFENVVKHLNFEPTEITSILGNEFKLVGADYSGAFNAGKYNSLFRSYDNGLGKRFEINEMYLNAENDVKMTIYNEAINFDIIGNPATLQKLKGSIEAGSKDIYDLDFNVGNRSFSMSAEGFSYSEFVALAQKIARQAQ